MNEESVAREKVRQDLAARIHPDVPERYRRLVLDVLQRLPDGWARGEDWSVTVSGEQAPRGFAHTAAAAVVLYPAMLDTLSDAACRWAIAHEFGHVAPVLPRHAVIAGGHYLYVGGRWQASAATPERLEQLYEDHADQLAAEWGFGSEAETFSREINAGEAGGEQR